MLLLFTVAIGADALNPLLIPIVLCAVAIIAGFVLYFARKRSASPVPPAIREIFRVAGASDRVADLLAHGEISQAIQSYHEEMNLPISEAKKEIERILLSVSNADTLRKAGIPANVVALMEQGDTVGLNNKISDQHPSLLSYRLSPWLAWLALLWCSSLTVLDIPFVHRMQLEATQHSWILSKDAQSKRSVRDGILVILILVLCFVPLFLFILVRGRAIYIIFFVILSFMLMYRDIVRYLLRRPYAYPVQFGEIKQKMLRTYISYVPQMVAPASCGRSWRGYEAYLDARMVDLLPQTSIAILQAHEQGHIAQGHLDVDFCLRALRIIVVLGALLLLAFFQDQTMLWTGPLAALFGLIFILFLSAPELTYRIFRSRWEKAADSWAARHVGQQKLTALRVKIRVNKYYD